MENCLFCKIIHGEMPSKLVYQDENVVAFQDINPQAPVHVLVVPRRHIASMDDITPEDGPLLTQIFVAAQHIAKDQGLAGGYRFITNMGPDAGQSVLHLHFHLIGGRPLEWHPS